MCNRESHVKYTARNLLNERWQGLSSSNLSVNRLPAYQAFGKHTCSD